MISRFKYSNKVSIIVKNKCFINQNNISIVQSKKIIHKNQIQNKYIESTIKIQNICSICDPNEKHKTKQIIEYCDKCGNFVKK